MKFRVRDTLIWKNFNVDAFLRLSAEPDIRAPVKELFLASAYLLSLARLGPQHGWVLQVGMEKPSDGSSK